MNTQNTTKKSKLRLTVKTGLPLSLVTISANAMLGSLQAIIILNDGWNASVGRSMQMMNLVSQF